MGQWSRISQCFGLVLRAEERDGQQYDRVIRSRLDLFWFQPHPLLHRLLPRNATSFASFWHEYPEGHASRGPALLGFDMHFIVPRRWAAAIFGLFDRYLACNGTQQHPWRMKRFSSEGILLNAMTALGDRKPLGVNFVVVRKHWSVEASPLCKDRLMAEEERERQLLDKRKPRLPCARIYQLACESL